MLHYIFKSLRKRNLVFNLFMWYSLLILVYPYLNRIPLKQKNYCLYCFCCCCFCSGSQKQTLHLDASCVAACHLWLYSLNLFQSSSVCIATLLILHCCWLQWKLNFSTPHLYFFTHEWGADIFLYNACQKDPLPTSQLRSCANGAVHGVL